MSNPKIPNTPNLSNSTSRPGYEYLTCYMLGIVIQELTDQFCDRFLTPKDPNLPNINFRQIQQMTQAARSNPQNVAEGYSQVSLKGYIYLSGIAFGSNEELTNDFIGYLKKNHLEIWPATHAKIREFRAFRVKWISRTSLNTPKLPKDPNEAANLILTLCNMEGYLLKKLIESLKEKHKKEGGLTERLYKERKNYRGY